LLLSGAPESNNIASAEATGAANKTCLILQQYRLSSDKSPFHDTLKARKNPRNLSGKVAQNPKVCYNQIDIPFT